MATESKQPNPTGGDEDSWETLAEDLFGIDFHKAASPRELDETDDIPAEEAETSPFIAGEQTDAPPHPGEEDDAALPGTEAATGEPDETIESPTETGEATSDDGPETGEEAPQPDAGDRDSFWDALDEWNWGNEKTVAGPSDSGKTTAAKSSRRKRSAASSSGGPSARRSAVRQPSSSGQSSGGGEKRSPVRVGRDEDVDDEAFGCGVFDELEPPTPTERQQTLQLDEPETVETGTGDGVSGTHPGTGNEVEESPVKRRRKRRRRRPRGEEQEPAGDETADAGTHGGKAHVEAAGEEEIARERVAQADAEEPARPRKSSRRRSRRRRKESAVKPPETKPDEQLAPGDEQEEEGFEDESADWEDEAVETDQSEAESQGEVPPAYRNLPTWEEAISYLLNPGHSEPRDVGSSTKPRTPSQPKSDSPKSSGRRGRRRR